MTTSTHRAGSLSPLSAGAGEMRARCAAFDWSTTPLGASSGWPERLHTSADIVLGAAFPMVLLWGPHLVQLYNDGYVSLLAAKHPAALGQPTRECWPEVWHINSPIYDRVRAGETVAFEDAKYSVQRQGPDGPVEQLYITLSYSPVRDADGSVAGVLITMLDTTAQVLGRAGEAERQRLGAALAAAPAQLLDEVFRQAPSFLAVYHGPSHVYALANDAYYQLVGHGRQIIGKPLLEALPEVAGQGFDVLLDRVLQTGEPFVTHEIPVKLARTRGALLEDRMLALTYLPLVDAAGARIGVIAHGTDVTEHVLARREVERLLGESESARAEAVAARADAEVASKTKSEFLAVMSHELRTPLNAIAGYAELIELGLRGPVTPEQRIDLARIQKSQRHLLGLINGVLNYARAEAGAVQYEQSDVPLDEVLATCEALLAPQARAKRIELRFAGCDLALAARADREKLLQIVLNLLSNAIKFTGLDGVVTLLCESAGDAFVQVRVSDTGRGIAPLELERLFHPFVQIDARLTRTHEGMGLGLAISRNLARGMGGDITVESVEGVGSTFILTLPAAFSLAQA